MVRCPECGKWMKIEKRQVNYIIGLQSFLMPTKIAVCECECQIALVSVNFDGENLTIEELEDGSTNRWN
jgi:hypothetical protein